MGAPAFPPKNAAGAAVEQTAPGTRDAAVLVASFDGLGVGFEGPHGPSPGRNPSDNSLAVGPDHIVQTVNSRMAIFTKKGKKFDTTGKVLYGAVPTNTVFAGFGGTCEARNNGDTVVRYDQLADRWLIVMPIFRRARGAARSAAGVDAGRHGLRQRRRASPASPAPRRSCSCRRPRHRRHPRRHRRRLRAAGRPRRRRRRQAAGPVLDVLRGQHRRPIRSARTTATSSCGRSFPTIRVRRSGPTATTCRPAPATTSSRSTPASSIATRMLQGRAGDRAVRRHRRRQLPQQRRPRRQARCRPPARRTS